MNTRRPAEVFPPGEFIRDELEERGWTQADLAEIMRRPKAAINMIVTGKKGITAETATELASAFGTSAEFWLNLDSAYRLSKVEVEKDDEIRQRAGLFSLAPIKDMQKRGWIKVSDSLSELEAELKHFFSTDNLSRIPDLKVAARTSASHGVIASPEQKVWCFQALRRAKDLPAAKFSSTTLSHGLPELRGLAAFAEEARKVPRTLAKMGVRFVIVEHLPRTKIDGAALWLDDDKPVVALSLRYDRIDCFWHTLCHELSHIRNNDTALDEDLLGDKGEAKGVNSEIERRANREAAAMLIPEDRIKSFILRVKPYYSKQRIVQLANILKIHPGIVAGQLRYRGEIEWAAHREMLLKIRDIVTAEAVTDGWGY
jgi:HTH-type transcriptional regulator / antitoxin HigA